MSVFEMRLKHDPSGRIVEKTETVAGRSKVWKYAYDKAGRLFEAHLTTGSSASAGTTGTAVASGTISPPPWGPAIATIATPWTTGL